jgi:hypothetical protein
MATSPRHSETPEAVAPVALPLHDIAHAITTGVMRALEARATTPKHPHPFGGCIRLMFWVGDGTTETTTVSPGQDAK